MKLINTEAGVAALRHSRANVVTAAIDRIDFHHPVFIGDFLTLKASLNFVGKTSMEVGVRVESENPLTGEKMHTGSEYLTYVALDRDNRPIVLPPLILQKNQDIHRNKEAQERRQMRLAESKKVKQSR